MSTTRIKGQTLQGHLYEALPSHRKASKKEVLQATILELLEVFLAKHTSVMILAYVCEESNWRLGFDSCEW